MTKKQEEKEEVYYVGVKDPIEIRRSLLESSREIVQYLQRSERFKGTRSEKAEELAKLKETMREINSLMRKLKTAKEVKIMADYRIVDIDDNVWDIKDRDREKAKEPKPDPPSEPPPTKEDDKPKEKKDE